jgi:hypothetical protein
MKNLLFNLSGISEFFNEKRFVYEEVGKVDSDPLRLDADSQPKPEAPKSEKKDLAAMAEGVNNDVRAAQAKAAESYAKSGFLKILDKMGKQGGVAEREKGNDRFSALRQQLIDNPKAFKRFDEYSEAATQELAIRGTQLTQEQLKGDDDAVNTAVFEARENRATAIPLIAEAFNENPKTKAMFLAAMVDLYIADLAKDKTAKDTAYNRLIADLIKVAPERTMAFLPSLKVTRPDALFVRNEKKEK